MSQLPWSGMTFQNTLQYFQVKAEQGLSRDEAADKLHKNGPNLLSEKQKTSSILLFCYQFRDFMVLVLLGATLLSGLLGEYTDALVIIGIVIVNAVLGFMQEYRAEKSLEALRELTAPMARVVRDGVRLELPAEKLVPGDIVLIEAGDRIPADIRLGEVRQLSVNEASLTGESEPINKQVEVPGCLGSSLGDRVNMVFMGTMAVGGRASGIVVATGMQTEMGLVAHLIQEAGEEATPLQKRLEQMGRLLVAGCLLICGLVVAMGLAQGLPAYKMFMAGVSLAVAAIPEGLPAVVTIALAVGVQRMVRKNAIVRRLPAVETLGCATVICADKTGTMTQNKMNVREVWAGGHQYQVEGEGYLPQGRFLAGGQPVKANSEPGLMLALTAAVLCNNAQLRKGNLEVKAIWRGGSRAEWGIHGDPTEGALLVAGARAGVWLEDLERQSRRVGEIPFDGLRKRMSVIYSSPKGNLLYVKGAPEIIMSLCSKIFYNGQVVDFSAALRKDVFDKTEVMAGMALRNLAVAYKMIAPGQQISEDLEENLVFAGLFGMMDPPRPEVMSAILKCRKAGIKTVMITGDHKTTALAIARMLRLLPLDGRVMTGGELDETSDLQLEKAVENTYVYARVTPEHKLRIVRALKRRGHVVAMTGDGVNDAPAVKEADIGIAMGKTGTDVTREAASMVLADDNFNTIVAAVEEGRSINDNIRKFIRFLLACNTGEILTMFIAMLAGLPLPLRAIQILWINLVTDGLPAMALGVEPTEKGVMDRPPRHPQEGIFARGLWQKILGRGSLIGITTVLVFAWALEQGMEVDTARTMTFATLIVAQLLYVFSCRRENSTLSLTGFFSNGWLLAAVFSSFALLLVVIYHPPLASVFATVPLSLEQWGVIIFAASLPTVINLILLVGKTLILPRLVVFKSE
ncbi:MAG: calcium-translocating P-type ATPase, SERCA-type [Dethiobacter sp.]|nr:calcium-translocating P-type ATPase, SERCA-type [Dethiobacter sp.]MBS3898404.1 calcium-translocating P-type ATPase, SERCA-type [Dethiobacter sp.]MBS3983009.1 calcium-translocating P-type ATPase, SERCA-type [Dethiobacter sp.]MCL4463102.1 calcium-translocating P-type ATPase, SERCA-type [Bacillota bacterium]MCL5993372.1 calcium-translocating P-type ATPase, SERCA-type [Bacillota bacterium]